MFILTNGELALLIEALEHRASRHESMARFGSPYNARSHDDIAIAMRKLRNKIMKRKHEIAAAGSGVA